MVDDGTEYGYAAFVLWRVHGGCVSVPMAIYYQVHQPSLLTRFSIINFHVMAIFIPRSFQLFVEDLVSTQLCHSKFRI
jgi:hypothetical protein